jgi:hypothetical protein
MVTFDTGIAMVVTDLHGEGDVYDRLKSNFLELRRAGQVDRLIICGDLIHGYRESYEDDSLRMVLDVMHLQKEFGADVVTLLMGNHEMPHVYSVPFAKGNLEFTARFEEALVHSSQHDAVMGFLKGLPFYACTQGGVLISHAGATPSVTSAEQAERILTFDHHALLMLAEDKLQNGYDLDSLKTDKQYIKLARHYLALDDVNHPRFHHFLRGQLMSQTSADFQFLWDVLFAKNEIGWNVSGYSVIVEAFLNAISEHSPFEQKVIVAGHISVEGGHQLVGELQLRVASYAHAGPKRAGEYLMLDCAKPVEKAADLVANLRPTFG